MVSMFRTVNHTMKRGRRFRGTRSLSTLTLSFGLLRAPLLMLRGALSMGRQVNSLRISLNLNTPSSLGGSYSKMFSPSKIYHPLKLITL